MENNDIKKNGPTNITKTLKKNPCLQCFKRFGTPKDLRRHQVIHTGQRPYRCKHCKADFTQNGNMLRHVKAKHPKEYSEIRKNKSAISNKENPPKKTYRHLQPTSCQVCHIVMDDPEKLKEHACPTTVYYQCPHCGTSHNLKEMQQHQFIYKEAIFPCDECHLKFNSQCYIMQHYCAKRQSQMAQEKLIYQPPAPKSMQLCPKIMAGSTFTSPATAFTQTESSSTFTLNRTSEDANLYLNQEHEMKPPADLLEYLNDFGKTVMEDPSIFCGEPASFENPVPSQNFYAPMTTSVAAPFQQHQVPSSNQIAPNHLPNVPMHFAGQDFATAPCHSSWQTVATPSPVFSDQSSMTPSPGSEALNSSDATYQSFDFTIASFPTMNQDPWIVKHGENVQSQN